MRKIYFGIIVLLSVLTLTSCQKGDEFGESYNTGVFDLLASLQKTSVIENAKVIVTYPSVLDKPMTLLIDGSNRYDVGANEYFNYIESSYMDKYVFEDGLWSSSKEMSNTVIGALRLEGTVMHFAIDDIESSAKTLKNDYYILTGILGEYQYEYHIRINSEGYVDDIQYYVDGDLNIALAITEINKQVVSLPNETKS